MSKDKVKEKKVYKEREASEASISDYASGAYLEYAMSVVKGRAIPFIQDGLKPVHRRILYSMYKEKMDHTSVHKKSARVVGNVLGFYHPHGDQSVYDAVVRQAQDWQMRYVLIDGQGNFGSRDGDGAASMRYTEIKLSPTNQLYLDEIKDQCVDFAANYDGSEQEPKVLPARVPFILLNGNPGIGVGIASEIPSHNMTEVIKATIHYLDNPTTSVKGLMKYIKGPDFPTKGTIISSKAEIEKVYTEGRGAIRLRGTYTVEMDGKNWKLVFNELPYGVSVKQVMEEIDGIFNPEDKLKKDPKGKDKKISPEQDRKKKLFMNNIEKYTDGSSKDSPVRLVVYPKSNKQLPEDLANILLAYTSLESNYNANFTMVGLDGAPVVKNLLQIISEWSVFRIDTIRRRCEYHLQKILARMHILEGRKIILNAIDEVIKIIKTAQNPKDELMSKFALSEIQAEDVLDLKLRQISNLELKSIIDELTRLSTQSDQLRHILSSQQTLTEQMKKELTADLEKFADKRLTQISEAEKTDVAQVDEKAIAITQEKVTVAISKKGWVRVRSGEKVKEDFGFKDGDEVDYIFYCMNTDTLAIFDDNGKVYNADLSTLNKDTPINTLCDMGQSKFSIAFPVNKDHKYLLSHTQAFGFVVKGENLMTRLKAGKEMFAIPAGAKPHQPIYIPNSASLEDMYVCLLSSENRVLAYKATEVSEIGKGKGVGLMGLNNNYHLKGVKLLSAKIVNVIVQDKKKTYSYTLQGEEFDKVMQKRSVSAKGKVLNLKDKLSTIDFEDTKNTVI